jgi:hypothetical protein
MSNTKKTKSRMEGLVVVIVGAIIAVAYWELINKRERDSLLIAQKYDI